MARLYWTKGLGGGFRVSQSIARTGRRRGSSRRRMPARQVWHGRVEINGAEFACPHNHTRRDTADACKGPFLLCGRTFEEWQADPEWYPTLRELMGR